MTPSIDHPEFLSSIQDQHLLELSSARSRIRTLEASVFAGEQQINLFSRQLADLSEELLRRGGDPSTAMGRVMTPIPSVSGAVTPRGLTPSQSSSSTNPFDVLSQRPVDADLPPSSRHARRVSLSMLKARIEQPPLLSPLPQGVGSLAMSPGARSHSGGLPRLAEIGDEVEEDGLLVGTGEERPRGMKVIQFSDKEGIIWCRCCEGDLIVI